MKTNQKIAALAQKLTIAFFKANPTTTLTQSQIQKNCRQLAILQLEAGEQKSDCGQDIELAKQSLGLCATIEDLQNFMNGFAIILTHKKTGSNWASFRKHPNKKFTATAIEATLENGKKCTLNIETVLRDFNIVAR